MVHSKISLCHPKILKNLQICPRNSMNLMLLPSAKLHIPNCPFEWSEWADSFYWNCWSVLWNSTLPKYQDIFFHIHHHRKKNCIRNGFLSISLALFCQKILAQHQQKILFNGSATFILDLRNNDTTQPATCFRENSFPRVFSLSFIRNQHTYTHMFKLIANAEQWNIRFHCAVLQTEAEIAKSKQFCNSISHTVQSLSLSPSPSFGSTLIFGSQRLSQTHAKPSQQHWIRWALSSNQTTQFHIFPHFFFSLSFMDLREKLDCIENISLNIWTHASVKLTLALPFFLLLSFRWNTDNTKR